MTKANPLSDAKPIDSAVYDARIRALAVSSNYSDFLLAPERCDKERLNFIKRRKLYREAGKDSAEQIKMRQNLFGSSVSSISVSRYCNNEVRIGFQPSTLPSPPPPNFGARSSIGLTKNARSRIRRGIDFLSVGNRQNLAFITLSYSDDSLPSHDIAKKQLSTFFKALKRHREGIQYVWVAEIQPKRLKTSGISAIHFHIACNQFIDCGGTIKGVKQPDWLRETWRRITKCDKVRPNVIKVRKPAHYMAKYVSKNSAIDEGEFTYEMRNGVKTKVANPDFHWIGGDRYGMSHSVSKGLKPTETILIEGDYLEFNKILAKNGFFRDTNWCSDYSMSLRVSKSLPLEDLLS